MKLFWVLSITLCQLFVACNNRFKNGMPATQKVVKIDTPRSFVKNYGVKDNNPLFVFVGQKIAVEVLPNKHGAMDVCFKAKYSILERVYGKFAADTIEFVTYDHYGFPAFANFKNVLMYVSADKGTYFHQKYMYNDVYKTTNGKWAGPYSIEDYKHEYNKHTAIKPVRIAFTEKVVYPIRMTDNEGQSYTLTYPEPYFKTTGDSAVVIYGNYVEELFKLKRDGYLSAREIFVNGRLAKKQEE